jgi:hypothetical protein
VGYVQSRVYFRAYHLFPEITTEQLVPRPDPTQVARPLTSVVGELVVIIGADLEGKSDCIGESGFIVRCPYPLELGQACIQIARGDVHGGQIGYYTEHSICRSLFV